MFPVGSTIEVVGPIGSSQLGKRGIVNGLALAEEVYPHAANKRAKIPPTAMIVSVLLSGESSPRNFQAKDLKLSEA